jgi:hypothetical protein
MSFTPELFRTMPPDQYGDEMLDQYSGIVIPKDPIKNLAWRKSLLKSAKYSPSTQRILKKASATSPIFWLNAFGWTYLQKKIDKTGKDKSVQGFGTNIPFITWKVQDNAIRELLDSIDNGHHSLWHKSRDMGATWIALAVFQWYWQFRPNTTFLEISRKEKLVDHRGNMDSLFEKHRFMLRLQPEWLRPRQVVDREMHLENQDIGSTIEGESTNPDAGQASRKTAVFVDEAARIRELESIDTSLADTSPCIIYNSTPQGPNTYFTKLYRQFHAGTRAGKLILLPFWMHPDKGINARVEKDENGNDKVVSDWTKMEEAKRSTKNMAQNVYGEHGKAGDMFFDANEIEQHMKNHVREPIAIGNLRWREDFNEEGKHNVIRLQLVNQLAWIENGGWNPWRFWVPFIKDDKGNERPNQLTRYVFGVDISNGSGASNSVISVLDHSSGMIVAKFWDAFTSPEDLAEEVAKAQIFFGGIRPPRIVFEKNGPGLSFGKKIVQKLALPNIYYQEVLDAKTKQKTTKWGWHSSDTKKEILLRDYREALKLNTIINPSQEALAEALDYVYNDKGKIDPGISGSEDGGGTALHGDHVIADALLLIGRAALPATEKFSHVIPKGTPAWRRKRRHRARQEDANAWR